MQAACNCNIVYYDDSSRGCIYQELNTNVFIRGIVHSTNLYIDAFITELWDTDFRIKGNFRPHFTKESSKRVHVL